MDSILRPLIEGQAVLMCAISVISLVVLKVVRAWSIGQQPARSFVDLVAST